MECFSEVFGTTNTEKSWKHGYRGIDIAGKGELLWRVAAKQSGDTEPKFDILFNLPARALDTLRGRGFSDQDVIKNVHAAGMRCCRIDLAIDCYDKRIHPALARKSALNDAYVGRSMNHDYQQSGRKGRKARHPGDSMTVTFGARTGAFFFRVYDKQAQIENVTDGAVQIDHCTRFEMEIKGDRERIRSSEEGDVIQPAAAELVADLYVREGPACIAGVFAGRINFIDPKSASRKERAKLAWWWSAVIGKAEQIVLGLQRGISTPESSLQWLEKSVAPTVAVAVLTGESPRIQKMLKAAESRIPEEVYGRWVEYAERKRQRKPMVRMREESGHGKA